MSRDVKELADKVLAMKPSEQFLLVSQLFMYRGKEDLAWALASRICLEHEAAKLLASAEK